MIAYRSLRAVSLGLRRLQVALLRTEFAVSDGADALGSKAKQAAAAAILRKIDKGDARVDRLWVASGIAEARASDASDDWYFYRVDHEERLRLIKQEVL